MKRLIVFAIALAIIFSASALAHSGGTDEFGCHTNRKTGQYHCHQKKKPVKPKPPKKAPVKKSPPKQTKKK